jgi:hypothetical protein
LQGSRIDGGTLDPNIPGSTTNIWAKRLQSGNYAVAFINVGAKTVSMTCDDTCVRQTTLYGRSVTIRDLWSKYETTTHNFTSFKVDTVEANGGGAMFLVKPL